MCASRAVCSSRRASWCACCRPRSCAPVCFATTIELLHGCLGVEIAEREGVAAGLLLGMYEGGSVPSASSAASSAFVAACHVLSSAAAWRWAFVAALLDARARCERRSRSVAGSHGEGCRQLLLADRTWIAGSAALGEVGHCVGVTQRGQLPFAFAANRSSVSRTAFSAFWCSGRPWAARSRAAFTSSARVLCVSSASRRPIAVGFERFCGRLALR